MAKRPQGRRAVKPPSPGPSPLLRDFESNLAMSVSSKVLAPENCRRHRAAAMKAFLHLCLARPAGADDAVQWVLDMVRARSLLDGKNGIEDRTVINAFGRKMRTADRHAVWYVVKHEPMLRANLKPAGVHSLDEKLASFPQSYLDQREAEIALGSDSELFEPLPPVVVPKDIQRSVVAALAADHTVARVHLKRAEKEKARKRDYVRVARAKPKHASRAKDLTWKQAYGNTRRRAAASAVLDLAADVNALVTKPRNKSGTPKAPQETQ